jgi:hypothetical protein
MFNAKPSGDRANDARTGRGISALSASWEIKSSNSSLAIQCALAEIDGLAACLAEMGLFELIRENLFLLPAFGACANKRFQMFMTFKTWAVLRCGHKLLLWARTGPAVAGRRKTCPAATGNCFYFILGSLPSPAQSGV